MIDSNKLQWLKLSVNNLIKNVRDIEKISIVTYRDSVRCLAENKNNADTAELYQLIRELKAKGITRGNKAIHFALDLAIRNYLPNGNNQIILATDGKFPFTEKDYEIWKLKTSDKKIVLSVLAFGNDKKAIVNLKEISKKGKGNFIQIETLDLAKSAIFEEVKQKIGRAHV